MKIIVINLNLGNIGSILNMLKRIGIIATASSSQRDIELAEKLILPGVGSFDTGIKNIHNLGLLSVLNRQVIDKRVPVLGICLGMQLFTKKSEEGILPGLGWIQSETVRFEAVPGQTSSLKIPHMGWNTIKIVKNDPVFSNSHDEGRFYFVHSYHIKCPQNYILSTTFHGYEFPSAIRSDNIWGVQFHPEKSHKYGMGLLKNFIEKC